MTEWQDSSGTVCPLQARQTSPFLPLALSSKKPRLSYSWAAVHGQCFLIRTATTLLAEVTVAPGVWCPLHLIKAKTLPGPLTKKNVLFSFQFSITVLSWVALQTFFFLLECGNLGTKHLTSPNLSLVPFPRLRHYQTIFELKSSCNFFSASEMLSASRS